MTKIYWLAALPLALTASLAMAGPVSGNVTFVKPDTGTVGGTVQYLNTLPASVGNNNINVNDTIFAFGEQQSVAFGTAPTFNFGATPTSMDKLVSSYLIYFDPRVSQRIKATLSFTDTILGGYFLTGTVDTTKKGVFTSGTGLRGSQDNFGLTSGVTYNIVSATGLESLDRSASHFALTGTNTLSLDWTASNPGDYIRVITAAPLAVVSSVPEPETYAMMLTGLGLMGAIARRRKSKQG